MFCDSGEGEETERSAGGLGLASQEYSVVYKSSCVKVEDQNQYLRLSSDFHKTGTMALAHLHIHISARAKELKVLY